MFGFKTEMKMASGKHREIPNVEQERKMIPFATAKKLPLVNMSASWFLVSTYLIWILGSKLILSNNQSSATLCVLDKCFIVGLRLLLIIMNHGFVVFENFQLRIFFRRMCVSEYVIHTQLVLWFWCSVLRRFP